jgi:hypothetical protein
MPTPGYYKTNTRAANIRELIRMRGLLQLPLTFIFTKFVVRPTGGVWMPSLCAETDCAADELTPEFWRATERHRAVFERLGFKLCFHSKLKRNLIASSLDNGAATYLHSNQSHVATLVYAKHQLPPPLNKIREHVTVAFIVAYENNSVAFTGTKAHFDPIPGHKTVLVKNSDPSVVHDRFLSHVQRKPEAPRTFNDCNALRAWTDENRIKSFEARVARGLFVRMTDEEVEQAQRKMSRVKPPPLTSTPHTK